MQEGKCTIRTWGVLVEGGRGGEKEFSTLVGRAEVMSSKMTGRVLWQRQGGVYAALSEERIMGLSVSAAVAAHDVMSHSMVDMFSGCFGRQVEGCRRSTAVPREGCKHLQKLDMPRSSFRHTGVQNTKTSWLPSRPLMYPTQTLLSFTRKIIENSSSSSTHKP